MATLTPGDLLGPFAQSPDLTWPEIRRAYGLGGYSPNQVRQALTSAGVPSQTIEEFLGGTATAGAVVNGVSNYQTPTALEALGVLAGAGIAGSGIVGDLGLEGAAGASTSEGAAGGLALSKLLSKYGAAGAFIPLATFLETPGSWLRILKYVGGCVLIVLALKVGVEE